MYKVMTYQVPGIVLVVAVVVVVVIVVVWLGLH